MPRVPTYDALQVGASTLPQTRLSIPKGPDVGQNLRQMGQSLSQAGTDTSELARDMAQQAAQVVLNDRMNKAIAAKLRLTYDENEGYAQLKGEAAIRGQDGKPVAQNYLEKYNKALADIEATLGNDLQREMFRQKVAPYKNQFHEGLVQHTAHEHRAFQASVQDGTVALGLEQMKLAWGDEKALKQSTDAIKAAVVEQGRLKGLAAVQIEANLLDTLTRGHRTALENAIDAGQLDYATAYLHKYSDQMRADDILKMHGRVTKEMDNRIGVAVATEAVSQSRIEPSDAQRAFNIAILTESGARQFDARGAPLTSPKGAVGIAQVMPDTAPEAAKLAGLPWDERRYRNDAAYNRALGMAYFEQQLRAFGGDLPKAYAAYNAGAKWVKQAEQRAAKAEPGSQQADWFWQLNHDTRTPKNQKETQNYVVKNMQAYRAGQGRPARPTMDDIQTRLQNDPRLADTPERLKIARLEAERQFKIQTDAIKQREDQAFATALRGLYENGGQFSELPVSVRANIPPDKITAAMNAAQRIAKGDDSTSLWLYNKLTSTPEMLANLSDEEFYALRTDLSEADFKHFSKERAKQTGAASGASSPGNLNSQAIKAGLDTRLRMMGVDTTPKDKSEEAARLGAIRKFIDSYFIAAQREAGKKFDHAEVEQHLDALFLKNATASGWFFDSSVPMLNMKAGNIPSAEKQAIEAAFKRAGIDEPTDAQILDLYWQAKVAR